MAKDSFPLTNYFGKIISIIVPMWFSVPNFIFGVFFTEILCRQDVLHTSGCPPFGFLVTTWC